jgi:hypothetical protein
LQGSKTPEAAFSAEKRVGTLIASLRVMASADEIYRRHSSGIAPACVASIDIADECRQAALEFVNGVPQGWSKADLADWLSGPYASATRFKTGSMPPPSEAANHVGVVDPVDVDALLGSARLTVMAALEEAALPRGRLAFVERMIAGRFVIPAALGHARGWVPVSASRLRLKTRVLSLFAVDVLVRPADYANDLLVCHRCEAVVFDRDAVARGFCGQHAQAAAH